jgi:hypothetical protein
LSTDSALCQTTSTAETQRPPRKKPRRHKDTKHRSSLLFPLCLRAFVVDPFSLSAPSAALR